MSPQDPRLDWRPRQDPRSRDYPARTAIPTRNRRTKYRWTPGPILDQGSEGACVGFGWSAELAASPTRIPGITNTTANDLYRQAQRLDPWPGEDYEGTSVLAGAKATQAQGYITEYRWSFSIEDLRDSVLNLGPAVIGVPWLEGMYEPRPSGLLDVTGPVAGGHCLLALGYHPNLRIHGEGWTTRHEVFTLQNSWGPDWGKHGLATIHAADLNTLLADQGEACIPLTRRRTPA